ncbi:hypothetical protein D3C87_1640930 [compost metagenome]
MSSGLALASISVLFIAIISGVAAMNGENWRSIFMTSVASSGAVTFSGFRTPTMRFDGPLLMPSRRWIDQTRSAAFTAVPS